MTIPKRSQTALPTESIRSSTETSNIHRAVEDGSSASGSDRGYAASAYRSREATKHTYSSKSSKPEGYGGCILRDERVAHMTIPKRCQKALPTESDTDTTNHCRYAFHSLLRRWSRFLVSVSARRKGKSER